MSYALGFLDRNQIGIMKKTDGKYEVIDTKQFPWDIGRAYKFIAGAVGSNLHFDIDDKRLIDYDDKNLAYMNEQVGLSTGPKCCIRFIDFEIKPCNRKI